MAYFVREYNTKLNYLFLLIAVFALPVTLIIMQQQQDIRQHAQQVTPIYLVPSSKTVAPGDKLAIALEIKTEVAPIKEVQVNLSYPKDKLSSPEISYNNSHFQVETENIVGPGLLRIGRNATIPVAGYNQIASISFDAKDVVALSEIALAPGSYAISDKNKSLPVNLVLADDAYYSQNKPQNIHILDRLFDTLINVRDGIINSIPKF